MVPQKMAKNKKYAQKNNYWQGSALKGSAGHPPQTPHNL